MMTNKMINKQINEQTQDPSERLKIVQNIGNFANHRYCNTISRGIRNP